MINLQTKKRKYTLKDKEGNVKSGEYWQVEIKRGTVYGNDKLARKIAEKLKVVDQEVVKLTLNGMASVIFDELEDGQTVQVGPFTLQPSISVVTHDKEEDCSAKDVKHLRFLCRATGDFAQMRKAVKFSLNGKTADVEAEDENEQEEEEVQLPEGSL